jgi:hypothetical protein
VSATGTAELHARYIVSKSFRYRGRDAVLFVTEASAKNTQCVYCHLIAGIALFVRSGGGWKVEAASRAITESSAQDRIVKPRIIRTGRQDYSLLVTAMMSRGGQTAGARSLVSLVDGRFREVLFLPVSDWRYDDECFLSHGRKCSSYSTSVTAIRSLEEQRWPLLVVSKGVDWVGNPFMASMRFRFEAGRYVEIGGKS